MDRLNRVSVSTLLFLLFLSIYMFTMEGRVRFGDEGERYLTAQSIVERRDFAIPIQPGLHRKIGVDGRNYSSYELGSIIPLIPFYAIGSNVSKPFPQYDPNWLGMLYAGLLNPFITALTVVVLYRFGLALGYSQNLSVLLAALFGLATIAWPYSKAFEREPISAFWLLLSTFGAFNFRQSGNLRWLQVTSVSLGLLLFTKLSEAILVPFYFIYLFKVPKWGLRDLRRSIIFLAPMVLLLELQSVYNQIRFGNPLEIGRFLVWGPPQDNFSITTLGYGLPGNLFSFNKSIFIYSPIIIFFIPAWILFLKKRRAEALLVGAVITSSLLLYSSYFDWELVSWWGPRYLVTLTPLFVLPIGALFSLRNGNLRRIWYALAIVVGVLGIIVQIVGVLVDDREYLDITGQGISFANAIDFLRHGAIESLLVYRSPQYSSVEMNHFGWVLVFIAISLAVWIVWNLKGESHLPRSLPLSLCVLAAVLSTQLAALTLWVAVPYESVVVLRANTHYVAANDFLADNEKCRANGMYLLALQDGTDFQSQAVSRVNEMLGLDGLSLTVDDLTRSVEADNGTQVDLETSITLNEGRSLKISVALDKDATVFVYSRTLPVLPNRSYRLSSWARTSGLSGTGAMLVAIYEDDGNGGETRTTDINYNHQTSGWQPFWGTITTLPTTRRFIIKLGLWKTFGTVWVDDVRLKQIDSDPSVPARALPPCKMNE